MSGMMRRCLLLLGLWLATASAALAQGGPTVNPNSALNHLGEAVSVCGRIVTANFIGGQVRNPTTGITPPGSPQVTNQSLLLAYDYPYPGQNFSLLIPSADRIKFGTPEYSLIGKRVCVGGTIRNYQGRAQMILSTPSQITYQ
jgi:hypothetical protein